MKYEYAGRNNGFGTAGMVLAIIAAVVALIPLLFFVAIPLALLAVIFGLIGRSRVKRGTASNNGAALAGVAVGVVAVALAFWTTARTAEKIDEARQELNDISRDLGKSADELSKAFDPPPATAQPTAQSTSHSSTRQPPPESSGDKKKIAEFSGNGAKQTDKFTVDASWEVAWSYDCTGAGIPLDMFTMAAKATGTEFDVAGGIVMQTGEKKGSDIQAYHKAGEFFLDINTVCKWSAVVSG